MKIFLTVIGVILFLILFLLFCPFCVSLVYDNEVKLRLGYIFPVFRILPRKAKPETESGETEKPEKKKSEPKAKKSEKEEPENKDTKKKSNAFLDFTKRNGLDGLIEVLKSVAEIVVGTAKKITSHLVISKLDVGLLVVGEDAADTAIKFGYACSAIYPLISIIDQNVKKCKHSKNIGAGFDDKETKVHLVIKVRILPIFILTAAGSAFIKGIKLFKKFRN